MDHSDYGPTTRSIIQDKSFKTCCNSEGEHLLRSRLDNKCIEKSEKNELPFVTFPKHQKHGFPSTIDTKRCDQVYNFINLLYL